MTDKIYPTNSQTANYKLLPASCFKLLTFTQPHFSTHPVPLSQ